MTGPGDRPLLVRLARSLFPAGSFPDGVYLRAADEVLHHGWVRQTLRTEVSVPSDVDRNGSGSVTRLDAVVARLADSAHGTALLDVISDAAVRAALDAARTERVAAGRLAPPA